MKRYSKQPELRSDWQIEQGARCPCLGHDEYCPCQNVIFRKRAALNQESPK